MKKIVLLFIIPLLFISCEKVYINGDLDGMWKLHEVEETDSVYNPTNITYSFQRHLVMLGEHLEVGFPNYYLAQFDKEGDRLVMSGFYKWPVSEGFCDKEELKKYFIFTDTVSFVVETLNEDVLVMRDGGRIYKFLKW